MAIRIVMILALDAAYDGQRATVGLVEFAFWSSVEPDYCGRRATEAGGTSSAGFQPF